MGIAHRIAKRLNDLGKSERKASLEANLSDSFIRNIRLGRSVNPRIDTLKRLAIALETNVEWLLGAEKAENVSETSNAVLRQDIKISEHLTKVPVYGRAIGGEDGCFELNGTKLYDVMSPPGFSECMGIYAIEVTGNSMWPRYEEDEVAYIDPTHAVSRGDYVVVQVKTEEGDTHAFIKRYLFKTATELILEQFNPPKRIAFPLNRIVSVHYVVMSGKSL